MKAINKITGSPIVGTADSVLATAWISNIARGPDGKITFDNDGGSEVHWDSQETRTDENDLRIFVDEDGEECTENDIEFVEEN